MTDRVLKTHRNYKCRHNKFLIDDQLAYVECGICGEQLNPMWVLGELCGTETRFYHRLECLQKAAKKAEAKNRCKCEKCGQMTRIQR